MKNFFISLGIAILIILLLWNWSGSIINLFKSDPITNTITKTDTVFVPVVSPPVIKYVNVPYKVLVQKEPDTAQRKKVEKQTIVTGSEVKNNTLEVTKIDTSGNITKDIHAVPEGSTIAIDNTGNVEIKEDKKKMRKAKIKKILTKVGLAVGFAASLILGSLIK